MRAFALVRHGRTAWNDEQRIQGRLDISLSPAGRDAIRIVANLLGRIMPAALYSSPVKRAVESAEIIAQHLHLQVCCSDAFTELDVGEWQGLVAPDLAKLDSWQQYQLNPAVAKPNGGESLANLQLRSVRGVEAIIASGVSRCAIVTHGDVIRALVCHYLKRPLTELHEVRVPLGSMLLLELPKGRSASVRAYP